MKNKILLILFTLIFTLPRSLQEIKIALLLLLFLFIRNKKINKSFIFISFFYLMLFIIPIIVGILYNNQVNFIISNLRLNYFLPIFVFFLLQNFNIDIIRILLTKSSKISIILIIILTLSTLLNGLGFFPLNLNLIFYPDESALRLEGGYVQIINSSLTYLLFVIPIVFANFREKKITYRKYIYFIALFILAVISGRRILLLPFLIIILTNFKTFIVPIAIILFTLPFLNVNDTDYFNKDVIYNRFYDAINSDGDSYVRQEQSNEFFNHIIRKPLLGSGLGSYMKNYIRNEDYPTAYEKTYEYLIFSLGIPIFILLIIFYIFLLYCQSKNIHYKFFNLNFSLAIITLLLASYTNPYWLSSFDYVLPLALLMRFSQPHIFKLYINFQHIQKQIKYPHLN